MAVILSQASSKNNYHRVKRVVGVLQDRNTMQKSSLTATVRQQLRAAQTAAGGRSSHTVYGGHERVLRQTVIALLAGQALGEHENPGEATVHVLHGRVRMDAGQDSWGGSPGDLLVVPDARHTLTAIVDSAVLLTVAKR
jgi:quercetin dioxygenase-like cupin family protein